MKKKSARKRHHTASKAVARRQQPDHYLLVVRGWVFLVAFALMMGMGVVVGNFINAQMNAAPQVAGYSTSR